MFNRDIIQWFLDKQDNNTLKTVLTRLAGVVAMNDNPESIKRQLINALESKAIKFGFEDSSRYDDLKKRLCHNKQLINSHFYRGVSELPYKLLFAVIYTHLEFRYEVSHTITSHHVHHFHQTRIPDGTLLDYMVQYRKPLFPQFFLYPKKFLPENNPHHKEFHLRPYIQNNANQ